MSVENLKPTADGNYTEWGTPLLTDHYLEVDDPVGSPDDDSSSIGNTASANKRDSFTIESSGLSSETITKVEVFIRCKQSSGLHYNVAPFLRLSGTNSDGSGYTPGTGYGDHTEEVSRPGGGSWSVSDLASLEVGVYCTGLTGKTDSVNCTQVYVIVTYTAGGNHPAPTSLECDRQTTPTNAAQAPLFTAIFNADGGSGTAVDYYIQVAEDDAFSTFVWDSGWTALGSSVSHGNRCEEIDYDGDLLSSAPPDDVYYWRIKFRDASSKESVWSDDGATDPSELSGIQRPWDLTNYAGRYRLNFGTSHNGIPADHTMRLNLQTGNRRIVASNGCFNEAIQASGGFQTLYHNGKKFHIYLSRLSTSTGLLGIYVVAENVITGEVGTPVLIRDAASNIDTHNFPAACVDADGHIHVFYGCHSTSMRYVRTKTAGVTGSLSGEPSSGNWIRPSNDSESGYDTPSGATQATYPVPFYCAANDRVYVIYRYGALNGPHSYRFAYSEDNGETWTGSFIFINDRDTNDHKTYAYGIRYDETNERLFVSGTFTHYWNGLSDVETGIWCWYSDVDETVTGSETDAGFNVFRFLDGSLAGYVDEYNVGDQACTYDESNVILLHTDCACRIFTETLELDSNGKPVVFWEMKPNQGKPPPDFHLATEETDLCCAIWSGSVGGAGSWSIIYISQELNLPLRVRRSSIAIQRDIAGVLRGLMPVNSAYYWRDLPDADVDSSNITRSAGSNNYELVDDGFTECDVEATYCDIGASGYMSFSHSNGVPSDATILAVHIEAIVRNPGATLSARVYLDNGSTEEVGDTQSLSDDEYGYLRHTWFENPFTSSAWTKSAVDALEFGVENLGSTSLRVTRVVIKVQISFSASVEEGGTELYALTSDDDGATWSAQATSLNTAIGVAIMGHKHHLTNDEVGFIYTSGFDIFVHEDLAPYPWVLPSGIDLRIYYGGTEIARRFDYPNVKISEIEFKIQEAIPSGKAYGPDDYLVYIGFQAETTNPEADGTDIMLRHENFEQYGDDDTGPWTNWTVISGSWRIYHSPPNHSNKVTAGRATMEQYGSSGEMELAVGTDVTMAYVEGWIWIEGASSPGSYISLRDGAGDEIRIGITGSYIEIFDGVDTHTLNGTGFRPLRRGYRANMTFLAIAITDRGLRAWHNGTEIASFWWAKITDADTCRVKLGSDGYFDRIKVQKRLQYPNQVTDSGPYYEDTAAYDTAATSTYDANDARVDTPTDEEQYRFDIDLDVWVVSGTGTQTHSFRIWISNKNSYDGSDVAFSHDFTIETTDAAHTYETIHIPVTFGTHSFKIDLYDTTFGTPVAIGAVIDSVVKITDLSVVEPEADLDPFEQRGFTIGASIQGTGDKPFNVGATIDGYRAKRQLHFPVTFSNWLQKDFGLPLDFARGEVITRQCLVEWNLAMSRDLLLAISSLATVEATRPLLVEWGGPVYRSMLLPVDSSATLGIDRRLPVDNLNTVTAQRTFPVEDLIEVQRSLRLPIDTIASITGERSMPISYGGWLTIDRVLSLDYKLGVSRDVILPVEAASGIAIVRRVPIENGLIITADRPLPVEQLESAVIDRVLPIDLLLSFGATRRTPISSAGGLLATFRLPIGTAANLDMQRSLLLTHLGSIAADRAAPVGFAATVDCYRLQPISWKGRLAAQNAVMPVSNTAAIDVQKQIPVEYLEANIVDRRLPVSELLALSRDLRLPVEWAGQEVIEVLRHLPISHQVGISAARTFVLEYARSEAIERRIPVSNAISLDHVATIPVSWQGQVSFDAGPIPISYSGTARIDRRIISENLEGREIDRSIPIDFAGTLSIDRTMAIETLLNIESYHRFASDWGRMITRDLTTLIEFLAGHEALRGLPIENRSTIQALRTLLVSWDAAVDFERFITMPVSFGLELEVDRTVRISHLGREVVDLISPVEYLQGVDAKRRCPVSTAATLAAILSPLAIETMARISREINVPIDNLLLSSREFVAAIEHLATAEKELRLPVDWQGSTVIQILRKLPLSWRGVLTVDKRLPASSLRKIEIVLGRLLVEYTMEREIERTVPIEFGHGIEVARRLIASWLGRIDAKATMRVAYRGWIDAEISFRIEYLQGITATTRTISVSHLASLLTERGLPIDWLGLAITLICLIEPRLETPGLVNAALDVPSVTNAALESALLIEPTLESAGLTDAELDMLIKLIDPDMVGGTGQCH